MIKAFKKESHTGVPVVAQWLTNPTRNHEVVGSIPGLSGVAVSCGVGHRCGSDPALLWLWCRLAAIAPTRPLAWEPPYATGMAPEKTKKKKNHFVSFFSPLDSTHK